ncbi:hypothetical protein [Algoriphagus aquimarinus]|uniref:Uncharacterized protein n=1 Tax=Algoriphagus aquimarinus TaxID=237018 RepID=A0A5C7ACX1_9BACT|nr:hypothetical protein [Algoriphagus aquimarinus]TXE04799.1 hypothetical protein ESV85_18870 [Algoriphagus aquimarinus]
MKRRKFIQNSLLSGVATLGVGMSSMATPNSLENHKSRKSFNLNYLSRIMTIQGRNPVSFQPT